MVVKEIKSHIKVIDLDEVIEVDNITRYNEYGEVILHSDDNGNTIEVKVEYYEKGGDEIPPTKSRTIKSTVLGKLVNIVRFEYTRCGKTIIKSETDFRSRGDEPEPYEETVTIYNTNGLCNYEKDKTIINKWTNEIFTITAKLPSEVDHADTKGFDNVWYFVDKNNLITRCEAYDNKGRLIKLEDYPGNKMYVYGYYEDTKELLSKGITSILDDKIYYIEHNKFDDKGHIVYSEITSYEEASKTQRWSTYDDNGNCISCSEVLVDLRGVSNLKPKTTITKYKYNEDGRIIESDTDKGTKVVTYEYTYFD